MRRFVHRENIKHYRLLLDTTTDENKREIILRLLAEEEANEAAVGQPSHKETRASLVSSDYRYATRTRPAR